MHSTTEKPIEQKKVSQTSAKRGERWYVFAAKILAWQLAAIFVVELSLSLAGLGEEEIFKLDPLLGFKHMSNKKVTWRSEGFATSYFDGEGMREHGLTIAKPAGTYRVALLGDSLAESLQVPLEESFGFQVQETVSKQLKRPVQVLNFGTSGYSTVQEYLQLKQQALKYKPDLVLVCYNSRDCFENWSPPDEVLTNVRPAALHLPGRELAVDPSPVTQWMKTPRARFLKQVVGLRNYSRLWGLFSAAELDWSLHNDAYKQVLFFVTKPGKALRKMGAELNVYVKDACARIIPAKHAAQIEAKATDASSKAAPLTKTQNVTPAKNPGAVGATPRVALPITQTQTSKTSSATQPTADTQATEAKSPFAAPKATKNTPASTNKQSSKQPFRMTYQQLIVRTLGSLLGEMNEISNKSGAKFGVVILPVRSALSVRKGMETTFNDYDFNDEVKMLQGICAEKHLDLINILEPAKKLSAQEKDYLFYLVHLTPKGHEFVASQLAPLVKDYVIKSGAAQSSTDTDTSIELDASKSVGKDYVLGGTQQ